MALNPARLSLTPTLLGEGSFGRVVEGRLDTGVGRPPAPVAVKTITGVGDARRRFDEELRAHMHAAQHCDGVCVLHGTCEKNGQLCIVMKCYERSLDAALAEAPGHALDAPTAQRYAHSLFRTLRQLHECPRPLIVQDIKPQNILIDAHGEVVLADFGVAQVVRTQTRVRPSSVRGTFNYMSPEAFDPEAHGGTGPPADVWSLACVLAEMLSGRAPWAGMPMQQIITAVVVRRRVPDVPEDAPAAELLRRCFSFDAAARPTAADMEHALAPAAPDAPPASAAPLPEQLAALGARIERLSTEKQKALDDLAAERQDAASLRTQLGERTQLLRKAKGIIVEYQNLQHAVLADAVLAGATY